MKKVILTVAAVFAFGFANAQDKTESSEGFAKGDVFATGGFGFGSSKTGDDKESAFTIAPAVGYFVTENIAIGARLGFSTGTEETAGIETKTNDFNGQVFGRYYWTPASQFSLFGEANVGFGSSKVEVEGVDAGDSSNFGVNVGFGVNYFLSSNWSIEAGWAGLGFNSDDNGGDGAEKTNTFGLALDLSSINFGLNYKF